LKGMEKSIGQRTPDQSAGQINDRLGTLERTIAARPTSQQAIMPVMERFDTLERTIVSRGVTPQASLVPIIDRLASIERSLETRMGEQGRQVGQLADRVRGMDETMGVQRTVISETANRLSGEVKALGSAMAGSQAQVDRQQIGMIEKLQGLIGSFDRQRGELVTAVAQPMTEQMTQGISRLELVQGQSVEGTRQMLAHLMGQVTNRIVQIETQITELAFREEQSDTTRVKDLTELHDALVKINGNQQTLATSLDQWRLDTAGDLSVLNNRLEVLEKMGDGPAQQMRLLTTEVQSMHAMQLRREARKSRFRMWLFGTEDWFGDSWEKSTEHAAEAVAKATTLAPRKPQGFKFLRR
jgi:hypothetical protein